MSGFDELWQEYRKRRNLALLAFFGYTPVVLLFAVVTIRLFHITTPTFIAAFTWMAFYTIAVIRIQTFRCPRCGEWFFAKWWYHNIFATRCLHCGLRKYESAA